MNIQVKFYWSLFLRRLPVMLALVLICSAFGITTAYKLPPTYTTSARLLVEAPSIDLDDRRRGSDPVSGAEQLQVIEQQLLTRANLIDIANKHRVFENQQTMSPDAVFREMVRRTKIRTTSGRNQATLMTLSFEANNGRAAANVLNDYVTLILEKSSSERVDKVENTLAFFEGEVARLGAELDAQSVKIVEFNNANIDALPADLEYRLGRQSLLQERLARIDRDLAALEQQKDDLISVYESTGQVGSQVRVAQTAEAQQLSQMKRELEDLRTVYSDTNPNVVMMVRRIQALEEVVSAQVPQTDEQTVTDNPALELALLEIDSRAEALTREVEPIRIELENLERSINATASNAIALNALERDYANIQNRYNTALNSLDEARRNERVELASQGQRISIIESAAVPQDPTGPNRPRIAALGIGLGVGLAGAFFVLLEVLNRTIRRPIEIENKFNITPIATIPYMESRQQKLIRRGVLVFAFFAVLIGVPALLWYVDTNYLPLEIIVERVIARIGL